MSEHLRILEECIQDAPTDDGAADLLREIVKGAAERAPLDALIEMGKTLVAIRRRDLRTQAESN